MKDFCSTDTDIATGEPLPAEKVREMIESGMVPPVEEWKKMTADYKQASIPLGRFEFSNASVPTVPVPNARPISNSNGSDVTPRPNNSSPNPPHNGSAGSYANNFGTSASGAVGPPSGPVSNTFSPASSTNSFTKSQPSVAQQYQQQYQKQQHQQQYGRNGNGTDPTYASTSSSLQYPQQQQYDTSSVYNNAQRQQDLRDSNGGPRSDAYYSQNGDYDETEDGVRRQMDVNEYYSKYGLVTNATVESFHSEEENYWFHLRVTFAQSGYSLILYRLYDDFLEFQYALMDEHPIEAGKALPEGAPPGSQPTRIIPKMPGPVDYVDEVVCAQRVDDLTLYLKGLCGLPEYLRGHALFYEFLDPRPGDVTAVVPDEGMRARWEAAKAADMEQDRELAHSAAGTRQRGLDEEVVEYLDKMQSVTDGIARSDINGYSGMGLNGQTKHADLPPLDTSNGGGHFTPGYSMANSTSQQHQRNLSDTNNYRPPSSQSASAGAAAYIGSPMSTNSAARRSDSSQPMSAGSGINFISPFASSTSALPSQSQEIPASAPPPFVKIKIFHRNTDDLIAIRVPPHINLNALLDKVRERLGSEVSHVRFRDEGNGSLSPSQTRGLLSLPGGARLVELGNDNELDDWLKSAQRLVAYVD